MKSGWFISCRNCGIYASSAISKERCLDLWYERVAKEQDRSDYFKLSMEQKLAALRSSIGPHRSHRVKDYLIVETEDGSQVYHISSGQYSRFSIPYEINISIFEEMSEHEMDRVLKEIMFK